MNKLGYWRQNENGISGFEGFGKEFNDEIKSNLIMDLQVVHEHKMKHALYFESLYNFRDYSNFVNATSELMKKYPLNFMNLYEPPMQDIMINISRMIFNIINSVYRFGNHILSIKRKLPNSHLVLQRIDIENGKPSDTYLFFYILRCVLFHQGKTKTNISITVTLKGDDNSKVITYIDTNDLIGKIDRRRKDQIKFIRSFQNPVNIDDKLNDLFLDIFEVQKIIQKNTDQESIDAANRIKVFLLRNGYDYSIKSPCILSTDDKQEKEKNFKLTWISIDAIDEILKLI